MNLPVFNVIGVLVTIHKSQIFRVVRGYYYFLMFKQTGALATEVFINS